MWKCRCNRGRVEAHEGESGGGYGDAGGFDERGEKRV